MPIDNFLELLVDEIDGKIRYATLGAMQDGRMVLGGTSGADGGSGTPPGGFIGKLAQRYVAYDTTEAALITTSANPSLVDNLNHIRFNIAQNTADIITQSGIIQTIIASGIGEAGGMAKSVYDTDDNGIVDAAESVPWAGITDIPSEFTPEAHTHEEADITDLDHTDVNAIHDADFSASEGFMHKLSAGTYEAIKSNLSASVDPTADDDTGDGYAISSIWINTTDDKLFICLDNSSGAAVWQEVGAGGSVGALDDLTDVSASSPSDGDGIFYDTSSGFWVAAPPPSGGTVDAAFVTYTPTVLTDWDSDTDPGGVDDALDQLAERIDDVEGLGSWGTGTAGRVAQWAVGGASLTTANLIAPANVLTLVAGSAYTLTIPATGTTALLGTDNVFTGKTTFQHSQDSTSGEYVTLTLNAINTPTATHSGTWTGVKLVSRLDGTYSGATFRAMDFNVIHNSSGTMTAAHGIYVRGSVSGGGTLTTRYGIFMATPSVSSGSLTNAYGLYISSINTATSNNYAIYTSTGLVRFGDNVLVGTSSNVGRVAVDQSSSTGAIPVLFLDQGDVSEQCIKFSSDATDRDINLYTVNVTGTPTLMWDESEDKFSYSKGIIIDVGSTSALKVHYTGTTTDFLVVDTTNGFIGINNISNVPGFGLAVSNKNIQITRSDASPSLYLTYTGASAYNWKVGTGTNGSFIVQDITGGYVNPITVEPATPGNTLYLAGTGDVGFNVSSPSGQVHIDQSSSTASQPVLYLDQGDVSEPVIYARCDGSDQDVILIQTGVTGTPTFFWDESEDMFRMNKGLFVNGSTTGSTNIVTFYGFIAGATTVGIVNTVGTMKLAGGIYVGSASGSVSSGNIYATGNISADSFTDRTPYYEGDAIAAIKGIKNSGSVIDHKSLPDFAKHITEKDGTIEYERDLGAMISILTVAIQQLSDKLDSHINKEK